MPDKIGRYEITGELGKGAMGVVYKAIDPNIGRVVALKTTRVDVHGDEMPDLVKRFQNEARAAGVLNHPNIVTIYDAGEDQGVFYIAMEFIPGKTLAQLLSEVRVLSAEQLVNIGTQICTGLDYAHSKGVIHRDIKPPNIMIAPDGTVKIMDFGIAKAGASLTHTGEVLGTPNYMSPEQVKGKDLDGRTDLFSAGVILYEMATGERPFSGQNVTTIIYKIIHEIPPAPRELDVTVHPGLSQIITKCLAKDPEERYQSGADLATALKSYKIISVQEPRRTAAPLVSPSATGFATRPLQATPATVLRTAAPVTAAAAASAKVPVAEESRTDESRTEVIKAKPAVVQTSPKSSGSVIIIGVALVVILGASAAVRLLRHSAGANATPPAAAQSAPSIQRSPAASSRTESADNPPEPVSSLIPKPSAASREPAARPAVAEGVGDLRVTSNPPGAQIEVDGASQDWYLTPFNTPPLKSGIHTVRAQLAGLPPQTKQVDVVAGQKVTLDFQLAADKAIYSVSSDPAGAEIMIDGLDSGRATPAELTLTPGQHRIVLRLEGFFPAEVTTDAAAGQTITVSPALRARNSTVIGQQQPFEPQGLGKLAERRRFYADGEIPDGMGAVQIRTRPKGATITVDETIVPRPTPFRFPIRPGTYRITLQKDGFQPVTITVQIVQGQQLEINEILPPQR